MLGWWLALALGQAVDTGYDPADDPYGGCDSTCYEDGLCTARRGVCVAEGDDCLDSRGCEEDGRCTVKDGACVRAPGDCRKTRGCREFGECTDQGDRCVASSDADCRASEGCRFRGDCGLEDGRCEQTSAADCAASEICENMGYCDLVEGECRPSTDAHCAASEDCRTSGDCVMYEDRCGTNAETCLASERCATDGKCTSKGWACVIGSEADCKRSEACRVDGECTFDEGRCVARTDAACKASETCAEEGACWFLESTYEARKPAKSTKAGSDKELAMEAARQAGVLGVIGRSGDGHGAMCGPTSDADCKASRRCADDGWCTMREGEGGIGVVSGPTCTPEGYNPLFGGSGLLGLSGVSNFDAVSLDPDWGGGLIGATGTQIGSGGISSYEGAGGGGTAEGLAGYGTIDLGRASEPEPRVDPVRVKGDRKPRSVRVAMRAVRADVKKCTESEVSVAFEVSAKGKLSGIEVRSGADGKTASCVAKAVGKAELDKGPEASVTWTVRAGSAKAE